ncbi:predicted protein [Postia placenta Mad-698-R]|nr:predicted protein [Postia placenta Mad-698-R]
MSAPHFEDPLVAPRPHKLQPDLPANMARNLDAQIAHDARRGHSPAPNLAPGFVIPRAHSRGPSPQSQGAEWSPWAPVAGQQPYPQGPPQQAYRSAPPVRSASTYSTHDPSVQPQQPANTHAPPSLTAPLPTIPSLFAQLPSVEQPNYDPGFKVAWCRDVLALVDRAQQLHQPDSSTTEFPEGPARIEDPELQRLVDIALPLLIRLSSTSPAQTPAPPHVSESIYLLATCEASGAYPQHVQRDPRAAFRHFEQAAKAGHYTAWFRLGRDYENFNDAEHARQCFERGVKRGVESCIYRMGMAHLMGQLGLPANPEAALPLLQRAATVATIECPQPAYVYGLLLLGEFSHVQIPPEYFAPYIAPGSSLTVEARKHLERAAYLNFAAAQYKLGHAYEFAIPPFPFDALLSVQYYSLASQQGEVEADMALSKWFLCGAEGSFEKDEGLALTFAEKAARKGLPSAEFAMGYYSEVGVGLPKDIEVARKWYNRAAQHGNPDAAERLKVLSEPSPNALSREQHESLADTTIVRKRTLARQRSDARRGGPGGRARAAAPSAMQGEAIMEDVRRRSQSSGRQPIAPNAPGYGPPPVMNPSTSAPQINGGYQGPPPGQYPASASQPHMHAAGAAGAPPQRAFANAPRYSLIDPGSRPISPSSRPGTAGSGAPRAPTRQASGPGPGVSPAGEPEPPSGPKPRPAQTFEEMGIASGKLQEKECVIM